MTYDVFVSFFFFQAEDGIRDLYVTGVQTCALPICDLVWQTDNGGEFKGDFPKALGDSQHVRIPPAAHTYQSDVETVHRLEEDEFFDLEDFSSRGDFLAKVHTYQLYFNLVRPNSHKENLSPW